MTSLADADATSEYIVERVRGSAQRELNTLGIVPGTSVRLLRRSRGHVLLAVGDSRHAFRAALAWTPNVGKPSLFNALTGSRALVANYPGKTVELEWGLAEHDGTRVAV